MQKNIIKIALVHAGATVAYIALLVLLMNYTQSIFEAKRVEGTMLVPMVMLLLFVISAGITGFAVFGRPVMWYIEGKKKEALVLLAWTIGFLILSALLFVVILL